MNRKLQSRTTIGLIMPLLLIAMIAPQVAAQAANSEFWLAAQPLIKTMPGGEMIPMWAFAEYTDGTFLTLKTEPNVPGPLLEVADNAGQLIIHLKNDLTEPISLVIPSLPAVMDPNFFIDAEGRRRVNSFTYETHPGQISQYTWTVLRSGSFIYQSGTHPAVQVQMGLYGPVKALYDIGGIDNDASVFFSEIDPALHNAVATGNYGPGMAMTSTIDYDPKYFLINGQPYTQSNPPIQLGLPGDTVLLRFFNAGLESHFPQIHGLRMNVIAEDAYEYPYPKMQSSLLLAAGQTKDTVIEALPAGQPLFAIYDRGLHLTNDANSPGGMIAQLSVGDPAVVNPPPVITSITATPDIFPPASCSTQLAVIATDAETLSYFWFAEDGCIGTFDDPTTAAPIYTFPEKLPPGKFTLVVHVSDDTSTTIGKVDITIMAPPPVPEPELIIDNRDPGTASVGSWLVSGGANPWGPDSVYSKTAGDTFTFVGPRNGENNVYLRWTPWPSRSSSVAVSVYDGDILLDDTITVNQKANANSWFLIGTYTFTSNARVVITATGGTTSTNADAVRFTSTVVPVVFLDHVEVLGPTIVGDEMPPSEYELKLVFSDDSTEIIQASEWSVVDTGATISPEGVLLVPDVIDDTPAEITGKYIVDGCTYSDTLNITIVDGLVATEVIVDNAEIANTSQTGTWLDSGGADPYMANSVYSRNSGATFTFHAELIPDTYAVYSWWTAWPSRLSSVPVAITSGGASVANVTVNQKKNPSMWNLIGIYTLGPDTQVTITSNGSGSTNADAVKFTPVSLLDEIILDNSLPGTSSTGTWKVSAGANPYGSDSLWSKTVGGTYSYRINTTGKFDVYASWTFYDSRYTDVPYDISDGTTLITTVTRNQQIDSGLWHLLAPGVSFSDYVNITTHSTQSTFSTNADAIRLVPVP